MNAADASLHPCARCAAVQRTCCQRAEILVTAGDQARIGAFLASGRGTPATGDFVERRAPADPEYVRPDPDDPNWLRYTVAADGTRRMLRRAPNGDCTFLGATGCILPETVRPLVCRLYPYSYSERGLDGVDSEYCPTALLAPDGRSMAAVLDIPATTAEGWRRQLYEELRDGTP
jgi:Fe-S-cluster containining protein